MTGQYEKRGSTWRVRYTDSEGVRRSKSGFLTKTDAVNWNTRRIREAQLGVKTERGSMSFRELVDEYLAQHAASDATIKALTHRLADVPFSGVRIDELTPGLISKWRKTMSGNMAWDRTRAVKQVLNAAVEWGYLLKSPASSVRNPQPEAPEIQPMRDWDEVEAVMLAMPEEYRHMVMLAVGTGLRPQEMALLRWDHIDWDTRAIYVPAQVAKTGVARRVPMRSKVVDALWAVRSDSGLISACDVRYFRRYVWEPALRKAGLSYRRPYEMRHTYAAWSLRAGVSTFLLARRMGTSIKMIDRTYGQFAMDSEEHELALLDAFDGRDTGAGESVSTTPDATVA